MARKASTGMTGDQIERVFGSLSRIEEKIDGHISAFNDHVNMDMKAYHAIAELKEGAAKQKGYLTAMGAVGGGVVAALGYIADKLFGVHH